MQRGGAACGTRSRRRRSIQGRARPVSSRETHPAPATSRVKWFPRRLARKRRWACCGADRPIRAWSRKRPFFEADVLYGDMLSGRSQAPYDACAVRLTFGGGRAVSEAQVRGRLLGRPLKNGAMQLTVSQVYQFNSNDAYRFGAQAVEGSLSFVKHPTSNLSIYGAGLGGVTILGAVDSLPPGLTEAPDMPEDPNAGQGVSTGPRFYDYGPGANAGGLFTLTRGKIPVVIVSYELHHLYVLDGIRANHLLQRTRADAWVSWRGPWSVRLTGEYFDRRTFYQIENTTPAHFRFPQFRVALAWNSQR